MSFISYSQLRPHTHLLHISHLPLITACNYFQLLENINSKKTLLCPELRSLRDVISRKYFKLECLQGGQWEETGCEPISCPALPDVFQGMYTCTNGLYYNTICTLQCPDPTEHVRFLQLLIAKY